MIPTAVLKGCHRPAARELFSESNDNSAAILLTYGTARVLLTDSAEAHSYWPLHEALNGGQGFPLPVMRCRWVGPS